MTPLLALCLVGVLAATTAARGPWVTLQGGQYLTKRANDGDSFHVSVGGKEYIFRLYFVDAPETSGEFRDRVEEQARHFGVTVEQALKIGELAKDYTKEKLSQPFMIRTSWEDAMGRSRLPRYFAFVQTNDGDLGEQLVENGLARVQESATKPEGLGSASTELKRLNDFERRAREQKVGGWGAAENRMEVRAANRESAKGVDPFEGWFRPAQPAPTLEPNAAVAKAGAPAATAPAAAADPQKDIIAAKLDVNTASPAELENLPGVGPALAQRIIEARPFKSADDLRQVKGIGDKKYEKLRPYFN